MKLFDYIEQWIRWLVILITNHLPVKVIRDENGTPFLYRYYIFSWGNDGPGICFHRFVKSDPNRGFHDHPWKKAISFILCGNYEERIHDVNEKNGYRTIMRNRWTFNYLDGVEIFHRVMIEEGKDAWTFFAFTGRSKTWSMKTLDGGFKQMSTTVSDQDGGWQKKAGKGLAVHSHLDNIGKVIAAVDVVVMAENKVLLIKRGKDPFKDYWAFPGGRIEQKDDDILSAAYRELKEETNLSDVKLEYFKTLGNSKRDPRGFCLSNVFTCKLNTVPNGVKAGDDAVNYKWFEIDDLPIMAFDHREILDSILAE